MLPTPEKHNFYQAIGHLFYAIAAADKKIRPKEVEALNEIIKNDWIPSEAEEEAIAQIKTVFHQQIEQATNSKDALAAFHSFKKEHEDLFTAEIKKRIWKTVNTIAESVSGKNKSELVTLSKLSMIFRS